MKLHFDKPALRSAATLIFVSVTASLVLPSQSIAQGRPTLSPSVLDSDPTPSPNKPTLSPSVLDSKPSPSRDKPTRFGGDEGSSASAHGSTAGPATIVSVVVSRQRGGPAALNVQEGERLYARITFDRPASDSGEIDLGEVDAESRVEPELLRNLTGIYVAYAPGGDFSLSNTHFARGASQVDIYFLPKPLRGGNVAVSPQILGCPKIHPKIAYFNLTKEGPSIR